jgi:hypothetical protein
MKYLNLVTLGVILLLSGCGDSDDEIIERAREIERGRAAAQNRDNLKIIEEYVYEYHSEGLGKRESYSNPKKRITVIEFSGCEYVLYEDNIGMRWGVAGLAHKGNCKRCTETVCDEKQE